jgi:hypothetical protein
MPASTTRRFVLTVATLVLAASVAPVYAQKVWEVYGRSNGMVGNEVISMDYANGDLWVATLWVDPDADDAPLEGGVSLLDPKTGNFTTLTPEQGLAHAKVWTMLIDGNKIWFGTPDGVSVLDTAKLAELDPFDCAQAFTTYTTSSGLAEHDVRSFAKSGKIVWMGTNKGISSLDLDTETFTNYDPEDLPGPTVNALAVDGEYVWAGTTGGLVRLNSQSGDLKTYEMPDRGIGSDIVHVLSNEEDSVWLGTRQGIYVLDKAGESWTIYDEDVLPDLWVTDVVLSEEEVWVGTLKGGVAVLDRSKDKWKVLDSSKGMASDEVRAIEPAGDITYIGTSKGLNVYDPSAAAKRMRRILLYAAIAVLAVGAIIGARLTILKPSPEEIERRDRDREARERRKERKRTGPKPWEICKGVPKTELCGRCKYNQVRAGRLHCSKYDIDLETEPQ